MPESNSATLAEEWRIQPTIESEMLAQEIQAISFDVVEHGNANHVCTPECNHTQHEADQFADNLFGEIKPVAHGEKGHVCDPNCQHSQAEADKFAEAIFAEVKSKTPDHHLHKHEATQHGEKGHVCTAECQHSQLEADEFASKLFTQKSIEHGEKGHVCDANCQHSQAEADKFADALFSLNLRQDKTIKDVLDANTVVHETQMSTRAIEKINTDINIDRLAVAERQYQIEQTLLTETAINEQSVDLPPNASRVTERASISEPVLETTQHSVQEREFTPLTSMESNYTKAEERQVEPILAEQKTADVAIPAESIELPELETIEAVFELPQPEISSLIETVNESNVELEDATNSNEEITSYTSDRVTVLYETVSLEEDSNKEDINRPAVLADELGVTTYESSEVKSKNDLASAKILEDIPELAPMKQLLPTVIETLHGYIQADASAELEQTSQVLDELITLIDNGTELKNLTGVEITFMHEKIEELAKILGLKPELLADILQIQKDAPVISFLAIEILHGLKKHLSIEYSLEFSQVLSKQSGVTISPFIRVLGRLLLNVLTQTNRQGSLLVSS